MTNRVDTDQLEPGKLMTMVGNLSNTHHQILVTTSNQRPTADLYAFSICDPLPEMSVPLRVGDELIVQEVQAVFEGVCN